MKKWKLLWIGVTVGLLLAGCGEKDDKPAADEKQDYQIYVTSETDADANVKIKLDDYDPFKTMGIGMGPDKEMGDREFQIGSHTYTGVFEDFERFAPNNYWLESYAVKSDEIDAEFYVKEGTDQIQAVSIYKGNLLENEKAPASEAELLELVKKTLSMFLGENFNLNAYTPELLSHLDNLENAYDFDNNLEGFVSTKENADVDFYEVVYRKPLGDFQTEETIRVQINADGTLGSFTTYMLSAYDNLKKPTDGKTALEEKALAAVKQRSEDGTLQGKVENSVLMIDENGKLVFRVEVETKENVHPLTVYVVFPS